MPGFLRRPNRYCFSALREEHHLPAGRTTGKVLEHLHAFGLRRHALKEQADLVGIGMDPGL
jgi:hypothetical protein